MAALRSHDGEGSWPRASSAITCGDSEAREAVRLAATMLAIHMSLALVAAANSTAFSELWRV